MALNPNTDNYTVPGGIRLLFDDGNGYRDLGNIVELDLEPGSDELEHFTNRSGKRSKDKTLIIEEKIMFNFTLDEVNIENMKLFFRGGSISNVGAGTDTATDVKVTVNETMFVPVGDYYGLSSVTVRQFLDYVYVYNGTAYTDHSTEADSLDGTPFTTLTDADDYLYLGKLTQFKQLYFDFGTPGVYGNVVWEYWNGTAWTPLTVTGTADDLDADGTISFTQPVDWAQTAVDGETAYWIRASATTPWTTPATINEIRQNCVALTDYMLDVGSAEDMGRQEGRIARIAAGMLASDEEVKVSFTYTTWTSQKMALASVGSIEGAAKLEVRPSGGRGHSFDVVFGKASLKNKGSLKFDDKDWMKVPMSLEVLDNYADDPTYPFGYIQSYGVVE
jgi:hypothetical protein